MSENTNQDHLIPSCPLHLNVYTVYKDFDINDTDIGCPLKIGGGYYGLDIDEFSIFVPKILDGLCNEGCRNILLKQIQITNSWLKAKELIIKNTRLGVPCRYPHANLVLYYARGDYDVEEDDVSPFYTDLSFLENFHIPPNKNLMKPPK
ncbi:hypothetical protein DLAC_10958 [Tieghemostelium lacteum]|uniref:Uncharacterized protein n=1 Tax=Tieghemostelium lacteum TaxID=361077 RepID=A0A151Z2T3_TIELA|nr:hypothetical protein DLAC_10958 [Tieghemostelium lacteum]|eukprot:KYQ88266.1 hypothetical protein DLAC_10958 [Tieghemostelium lacteum]